MMAAAEEEAARGGVEAAPAGARGQVFTPYVCTTIDRGLPHPGDIAEAASLSAIPLPPSTYPLFDALPAGVVEEGRLSQLQLEGVRCALTAHQQHLPSGERAGFFIGDGAGVGKGRQIAAVILDNYVRGRRRAVWVSTSGDLYLDARRDLADLGAHLPVINNCQALDAGMRALGLAKELQEGVLFMTYATLVGKEGGGRGRSRLDQVVSWVGGPEWDGVLVLDEAHKAKNYAPGKEGASSKVALCVIELQQRLPRARVLYASATGVSEVANLAYMSRLGLWGPGTAWADFPAFLDSLRRRGVSFMEMLAMEMKAAGKYVARGLAFRDAEFTEVVVALSPRQAALYDAAAEAWCQLRVYLGLALELAGVSGRDVWKTFWAAQQRFFKLLCVSLKVPAVVEEAKAALCAGHAVVIGLQTTGEAAADALGVTPGPLPGFISTCKELLARFIADHFPTTQVQSPEVAASGVPPDVIPACTQMRSQLLEAVGALALPPNFLDQLLDELGGPGAVAEMTGRRGRVVRDAAGRPVYELRGKADSGAELDSLNVAERDALMAGHKLVAIISDAASTGISLHASARVANQRRRVHITIELPWGADKAIQQLGRTHRSNQVSAPLYKLVTTNVGGEKRFAAAVARRLQSLGALTRGDRRAAAGLDLSEQNFDSPWGRKSLRRMYDHIVTSSPALPSGVTPGALLVDATPDALQQLPTLAALAAWWQQQQAGGVDGGSSEGLGPVLEALHSELRSCCDTMGIGLGLPRGDTVAEERPAEGGTTPAKDTGDVRRFLNRLLGLPLCRQALLFSYFAATLEAEIAAARAAGSYNDGVADLAGSSITRLGEPLLLWGGPGAGACGDPCRPGVVATWVHTLALDRGVGLAEALQRLAHDRVPGDDSGFRRSRRPLYGYTLLALALQKPGHRNSFTLVRPNTGDSLLDMERAELDSKYIQVLGGQGELEAAAAALAAFQQQQQQQMQAQQEPPQQQIQQEQPEQQQQQQQQFSAATTNQQDQDQQMVREQSQQQPAAAGGGPGDAIEDSQELPAAAPRDPMMEAAVAAAAGAGCDQDAAVAAAEVAVAFVLGWQQQHTSSLTHCMHGAHCTAGPRCQVGKRLARITLLTGSVVRCWGVLEALLERRADELPRGERSMRVVRVAVEGEPRPLIGVSYPEQLLPEAAALLASLADASGGALPPSAAAGVGAAAGGKGSLTTGVGAAAAGLYAGEVVVEPPTPIDPRSQAKAFRPPRTLHDFFKPPPTAAAAAAAAGKGPGELQGALLPAAQQAVQLGASGPVVKAQQSSCGSKRSRTATTNVASQFFSSSRASNGTAAKRQAHAGSQLPSQQQQSQQLGGGGEDDSAVVLLDSEGDSDASPGGSPVRQQQPKGISNGPSQQQTQTQQQQQRQLAPALEQSKQPSAAPGAMVAAAAVGTAAAAQPPAAAAAASLQQPLRQAAQQHQQLNQPQQPATAAAARQQAPAAAAANSHAAGVRQTTNSKGPAAAAAAPTAARSGAAVGGGAPGVAPTAGKGAAAAGPAVGRSGAGATGGAAPTGGGRGAAVDALVGMGFSVVTAERALWATQGDLERAVEWCLSGM